MKHHSLATALFYLTFLVSFPLAAPAVEFSLYGDVKYRSSDDEDSFVIGPVHIIADQELSTSVAVTMDLTFEEHEGEFETHLERFFLKKSLGESVSFTAGRFQKTLGFWRSNFHHGSLSQDTVTRPFFLESDEFEEGVFPAHLVGILLGYETAKSTVNFAVANSSGMDTLAITGPDEHTQAVSLNTYDPGSNKTLVTRATYRIAQPLELGIFALRNEFVEIGEGTGTMVDFGETLFTEQVLGLDANFFSKQFYTFGEFYWMDFEDNQEVNPGFVFYAPSSESYKAIAYYLQAGYRFTNKFTLAARHESLDFDDGSTFFDIQGMVPETRNLLVFNYRFEESNVFRFELRQENREDEDTEMVYELQWFFYLL